MYTTRIQEVGIRLSNGAKAKDIFSQFMTDTAVVTILGFGLALVIVYQGLPYFNSMMDTDLTLLFNSGVMVLIAVLFIITVFSGRILSFPANVEIQASIIIEVIIW